VPRCFEQLNAQSAGEVTAVLTGPDGSRDVFSWNGSGGASLTPYFKNYLSTYPINLTSGWLVTQQDRNRFLVFDSAGALIEIHQINGQQVRLTRSSGQLTEVADSQGRTLQLHYGTDGTLSTVVDPNWQSINYTYFPVAQSVLIPSSATSKPLSVAYQDGTLKKYLWDEASLSSGAGPIIGKLTGIVDELDRRFASYGYSDGMAISTEHAGGVERYAIADSRSGGIGAVTLNYPTNSNYVQNYALADGVSRVISSNQPAGSGCAASASAQTYDTNGNVSSKDDFNGIRVCYANDLTRNLETTQVEGLSTSTTCSAVTTANAVLPVGSRKVSSTWHPDWRLETKVAEPGRITTSVYNGQPDPFNANAVASCAPSTALLPDGKPIAVLCKRVEQATTDADGHLGFTAALQPGVANRVQSWTYNQYGQVLTAKDPLNHTTTNAYYADTSFTGTDPNAVGHTIGDLQTVTNAVGKVTTYTQYDKHGNLLQSADPNGVVTTNTYDLRQRLLSTSVGGQTTSYSYDPAGQLLKVTAPDASWIGYEYDPAHRMTATKDNLGNRIEYTLDNAGNRIAQNVKDPGGNLARTLARSIDALGRTQQTTGRE
jgi:YD repeat-containing protein